MGKGLQWVEGQREGAKAHGGRQEAGAGAESTGSDPTWGARQEVEAGQPGSQLCKETFPWGGRELGEGGLLVLSPFAHPAPGWRDLRVPPATISPLRSVSLPP